MSREEQDAGLAVSDEGWKLVTDCETAGVLSEVVDLPVRAHPWVPVGKVFAINRALLPFLVATDDGDGEP